MPGRPRSPFLPLPKQWNKRVRSPVLHAISLAQFVLTCAPGQAAYTFQRSQTRWISTPILARSRTSGEYLICLVMTPSSQIMEPPTNPGRFKESCCTGPPIL